MRQTIILLVFQKLHSQKEFRDFKVICPLAYGNSIYIKEVIDRGNDLFGDKFEARQSFLPHQDYLNFLQEIDIAILDSSRQMGFGGSTSFRFVFLEKLCTSGTTSNLLKHF